MVTGDTLIKSFGRVRAKGDTTFK